MKYKLESEFCREKSDKPRENQGIWHLCSDGVKIYWNTSWTTQDPDHKGHLNIDHNKRSMGHISHLRNSSNQ